MLTARTMGPRRPGRRTGEVPGVTWPPAWPPTGRSAPTGRRVRAGTRRTSCTCCPPP